MDRTGLTRFSRFEAAVSQHRERFRLYRRARTGEVASVGHSASGCGIARPGRHGGSGYGRKEGGQFETGRRQGETVAVAVAGPCRRRRPRHRRGPRRLVRADVGRGRPGDPRRQRRRDGAGAGGVAGEPAVDPVARRAGAAAGRRLPRRRRAALPMHVDIGDKTGGAGAGHAGHLRGLDPARR